MSTEFRAEFVQSKKCIKRPEMLIVRYFCEVIFGMVASQAKNFIAKPSQFKFAA